MIHPARQKLVDSDAESLDDFEMTASRCRTPKQFRELIDRFQTVVPYRQLICGWGYTDDDRIGFIFNHGYPIEILRWYLTNGLVRKDPVFQEWLRTKQTYIWLDAAKHLKDKLDPEFLERMTKLDLQYSLGGGLVRSGLWVFFSLNMGTEESCRAHLKRFQMTIPVLVDALQCACPRPLLTNRETKILERRSNGEIIKQIAAAEGIAERTVKMHLQQIKKKLYTDDLVNAVVIAIRSGMIDHTWKEWRWQK